MGLFDIFKRRSKKEKQSAASEAAVKDSAAADKAQQIADQTISIEDSESASIANKEAEIKDSLASHEVAAASSASASESERSDDSVPADSNEQQTVTATSNNTESDATEIRSKTPSADAQSALESSDMTVDEQVETGSNDARVEDQPTSNQDATESAAVLHSSEEVPKASSDTDVQAPPAAEQEMHKYEHGLAKSRLSFGQKLNQLFANFRSVDEDFFEDLEDTLIESDVGFDMAVNLTDQLREEVKLKNVKSKSEVQNVVVQKLIELYDQSGNGEKNTLNFAKEGPTVILFVGVNGVGKTTTIGKMAKLYHDQGKKVLLAAADTFRAGAIQQLDVWAKRDGVDIVTRPEKSDPASVVYEAIQKAKKEQYDVLFVDTAGRLQNKVNLMNELSKMKKVLTREIPTAPNEVMLVLDATTGQNALSQAKLFKQVTDVTGITLTKLDGTARGGIVLAIRNELHIPVKYVGLGEQVGDLQPFNASDFVYGLFKGLLK